MAEFGYADAFAMLATIGIVVSILSPLYPGYIEQEADEEVEPFKYRTAAAKEE